MREASDLDGFFGMTVLGVLRSLKALNSQSFGEVTKPSVFDSSFRFEPGGLFSESIFGPLRAGFCFCGRMQESGNHRGHKCPLCGVDDVSPGVRDVRWGHIELPYPLLHPVLLGELVRVTRIEADELRSILTYKAQSVNDRVEKLPEMSDEWLEPLGAKAIRMLLAKASPSPLLLEAGFALEDLLITQIPVPPPTDRPLIFASNEPSDRLFTRQGAWQLGSDNRTLQKIIHLARKLATMLRMSAPLLLLAEAIDELQGELEKLVRLFSSEPGSKERCELPATDWEKIKPAFGSNGEEVRGPRILRAPLLHEDEFRYDYPPAQPNWAQGVSWLHDDRLIIQLGYAAFTLDTRTGALGAPFGIPQLRLRGTWENCAYFAETIQEDFVDSGDSIYPASLAGIVLYDVDAGSWREGVADDGIPMVFVNHDQPEDAWLEDARTGSTNQGYFGISVGGDRPQEICRTPDHRFIWISSTHNDGEIFDVRTGRSHFGIGGLGLDKEIIPILDLELEIDAEEPPYSGVAMVREPHGTWWIYDARGVLSRDGLPVVRLPWRTLAAAFDASAQRLALVSERFVRVIDVQHSREVVATFDIGVLDQALGAGKYQGLGPKIVTKILQQHGTLSLAQRSSEKTLRKIHGVTARHIKALKSTSSLRWPKRIDKLGPKRKARRKEPTTS